MQILVVNSGSSSIKFSIYSADEAAPGEVDPVCQMDGELSGVGSDEAELTVAGKSRSVDARDESQAVALVMDAASGEPVDAVGYRVVHPGAKLRGHQRITPQVIQALETAKALAPLHEPEALGVIRAGMKQFPAVEHYACFDTVFHETMPEEATVYALPHAIRAQGVRRYGFHGLSCESVVLQLRAAGEVPARMASGVPQRMAIAHLGSGCSVTALLGGVSVDNTMGMTPTGGVVMGTRPGDLDPGVVLYLLRQQGAATQEAVAEVQGMLNHRAGLVALSGMGNDVKAMRAAAEGGDEHAQLALKVFARSVRKAIGAYSFLLGGLDAVVFSGGVGEHDAATRGEVLAGLEGLGIEMANGETVVSGAVRRVSVEGSETAVYVVPADEDRMIAVHVARMAGRISLSG